MKNLLIIFLFLSTVTALSQVKVFRSFKDYENKTGEEYDELIDVISSDSKKTLKLSKNGQSHKIKCKDMWGFTIKKILFRVDQENGGYVPARVISKNKLVYYENGMAHLEMVLKDETSSRYYAIDGYSAYISKDLKSILVPLEKGMNFIDQQRRKKRIKKFKKEFPEYNEFFDCLQNYRIETVRRCIAQFEGYD